MMKIFQVVGYKNAGKTTLVCEIVRELTNKGLRVGTVKHDVHDFEPDVTGTDTWQHRQAGAHITAITSPSRTAWVQEQSTPLEELVSDIREHALDYLIIEGFKSAAYPKVVLLRNEQDNVLLSLTNIIAVIVREPNDSLQAQAKALAIPVFIQPDPVSSLSFIQYLIGLPS
ncbi:molybdopterin-guanine dinucleotide biosynthesis protein B [Cohnella sp.]|uniref:molybdopterin-guanine dinucleotide biosynthesis protein B n=1 Tax=Cohnella sp. TaxID=1883426 RepID=UPI0035686702